MGRGDCGTVCVPKGYLIFDFQLIIYKKIFSFKNDVLSVYLLGCILVVVQLLSKRMAFVRKKGKFCSIYLSRPSSG